MLQEPPSRATDQRDSRAVGRPQGLPNGLHAYRQPVRGPDAARFAPRFESKTFFAALTRSVASPQTRALLASAHASPLEMSKHANIPKRANSLLVLTRGCVCSYRNLPNGSRQILKVLAPGELCNPWVLYSDDLDMDLVASSVSRLISLPLDRLKAAPEEVIARILAATVAREHLLMIESIVMLGRRTARERVTYFLLDLVDRLQHSGLALDDSFDIGVTQGEMGDALGISTVHTNRALSDLKAAGMVRIRGKHYDILNRAALEKTVSFASRASLNATYA